MSGRFSDIVRDVGMDLPWSSLRNIVVKEEALLGCATYVGSLVGERLQ